MILQPGLQVALFVAVVRVEPLAVPADAQRADRQEEHALLVEELLRLVEQDPLRVAVGPTRVGLDRDRSAASRSCAAALLFSRGLLRARLACLGDRLVARRLDVRLVDVDCAVVRRS